MQYYRSEVSSFEGGRHAWEKIIGESAAMGVAKKRGVQAASSDASALITGESGTGKELFAQAIHQNSRRAEGPFIKVNCAAIPHDLIESEIFGYEGGAFTGARTRGKPGKFELADHGTIFLDEIERYASSHAGEIAAGPSRHEVERIGATNATKLDFRVIAATNQDLGNLIKEGHFVPTSLSSEHIPHPDPQPSRDAGRHPENCLLSSFHPAGEKTPGPEQDIPGGHGSVQTVSLAGKCEGT